MVYRKLTGEGEEDCVLDGVRGKEGKEAGRLDPSHAPKCEAARLVKSRGYWGRRM